MRCYAEAKVNTLDRTRMDSKPQSAHGTDATLPTAARMGYLLAQYPAPSEPLFLHEIAALRARGLHLETASIARPKQTISTLTPTEASEARQTFYVRSARRMRRLKQMAGVALHRPDVVLRGLKHVLTFPDLRVSQRWRWMLFLAEALIVGRWMQVRKLDHLHVHFGDPVATVGMLTARAWNLPWSLTIHGPEELLNRDAVHLREKVATAKFVFCSSDFCRSQLLALSPPVEWGKFQVIRLGVDPLVLTPPSRLGSNSIQPRQAEMKLVCIGGMVPAKGHYILLEAIRLLRERQVEFQAVLIGGGPELPRLQEYVAKHGLTAFVSFTGPLSHPQTLAHLRRADVFTLASFAEGLPLTLMEAMSLGLPCVSTTVAGIPELIRSGLDGLLVPPANATALAAALQLLASDPALRRSLGASARQRIIRQYNLPLNQEVLAHSFRMRTGETPSGEEGPSAS